MSLPYVIGHLAVSLACFFAVTRSRKNARWPTAFGVFALLLVVAGFTVERRPDWAWRIMPFAGSGLVFLTNVSLEGVAVLCALMGRATPEGKAQRRSLFFALPLLAVSLWSYVWYFEPVPDGLTGQVDASGFCEQTSDDSCSAAAAAMLLSHYGIATTEAEMAGLCLTRAGRGTSPLGLYRGVEHKAAPYGLRPHLVYFRRPEELRHLQQPTLINVGLSPATAPQVASRMVKLGWQVGAWHTVVIRHTDPTGQVILVADPTNGEERWPVADLGDLWDGSALVLDKR